MKQKLPRATAREQTKKNGRSRRNTREYKRVRLFLISSCEPVARTEGKCRAGGAPAGWTDRRGLLLPRLSPTDEIVRMEELRGGMEGKGSGGELEGGRIFLSMKRWGAAVPTENWRMRGGELAGLAP
ncbi:hypothetical protein MRX96_013152 [Rhipicephalus microplus]